MWVNIFGLNSKDFEHSEQTNWFSLSRIGWHLFLWTTEAIIESKGKLQESH